MSNPKSHCSPKGTRSTTVTLLVVTDCIPNSKTCSTLHFVAKPSYYRLLCAIPTHICRELIDPSCSTKDRNVLTTQLGALRLLTVNQASLGILIPDEEEDQDEQLRRQLLYLLSHLHQCVLGLIACSLIMQSVSMHDVLKVRSATESVTIY